MVVGANLKGICPGGCSLFIGCPRLILAVILQQEQDVIRYLFINLPEDEFIELLPVKLYTNISSSVTVSPAARFMVVAATLLRQ